MSINKNPAKIILVIVFTLISSFALADNLHLKMSPALYRELLTNSEDFGDHIVPIIDRTSRDAGLLVNIPETEFWHLDDLYLFNPEFKDHKTIQNTKIPATEFSKILGFSPFDIFFQDGFVYAKERLKIWSNSAPTLVKDILSAINEKTWYYTPYVLSKDTLSIHQVKRPHPVSPSVISTVNFSDWISAPLWNNRMGVKSRAGLIIHLALRYLDRTRGLKLTYESTQRVVGEIVLGQPALAAVKLESRQVIGDTYSQIIFQRQRHESFILNIQDRLCSESTNWVNSMEKSELPPLTESQFLKLITPRLCTNIKSMISVDDRLDSNILGNDIRFKYEQNCNASNPNGFKPNHFHELIRYLHDNQSKVRVCNKTASGSMYAEELSGMSSMGYAYSTYNSVDRKDCNKRTLFSLYLDWLIDTSPGNQTSPNTLFDWPNRKVPSTAHQMQMQVLSTFIESLRRASCMSQQTKQLFSTADLYQVFSMFTKFAFSPGIPSPQRNGMAIMLPEIQTMLTNITGRVWSGSNDGSSYALAKTEPLYIEVRIKNILDQIYPNMERIDPQILLDEMRGVNANVIPMDHPGRIMNRDIYEVESDNDHLFAELESYIIQLRMIQQKYLMASVTQNAFDYIKNSSAPMIAPRPGQKVLPPIGKENTNPQGTGDLDTGQQLLLQFSGEDGLGNGQDQNQLLRAPPYFKGLMMERKDEAP